MAVAFSLEPELAVDLARYRRGDDSVVQTARRALRETGFLVLVEHGLDEGLLERGYAMQRELFAMPLDAKRRYLKGDGSVGYIPRGVEQALRARVPDLKELWHHGHGANNRAVHEIAGFDQTLAELDDVFASMLTPLMELLSEVARMPAPWLREVADGASHMLRLVHYPRVPSGALGMRAFEHTGAGLLGLLPLPTAGGLQLQRPDGVWVAPEGLDARHVVVTIADQIARLSNGVIPASVHRVVNRPGTRDAIVYFAAAHPDTVLWPPPALIERGGPPPFERMTSEEFTVARLRRVWRNEGSWAYRWLRRGWDAIVGSDANR